MRVKVMVEIQCILSLLISELKKTSNFVAEASPSRCVDVRWDPNPEISCVSKVPW